jgi:tetratricopeptide (TPR) repeat protein
LGETEVNLASTEGFEVRRFDQATFYQKSGDGTGPATPSVPLAMPVLVSVALGPVPTMPTVPSLPDWVPLPAKRSEVSPAVTAAEAAEPSVLERVQRCIGRREFAEAERAINRIAHKKERAEARLQYARALLARAESAGARRMLDVCLAEEPLLIEAQLLKASFLEESGDLHSAEQAYRRALYIDRNSPIAHFHLALVQQQKGDTAGAVRTLHTMLRLTEGKDPHALVEYGEGVCYGRLKELAAVLLGDLP